jgi:hypothetical protein
VSQNFALHENYRDEEATKAVGANGACDAAGG